MRKYTLSKLTDFVFKTTLTFFIFFVWIRFYVKALYLSLFLTVLTTAIFVWFFTYRQNKKYTAQKISKEEDILIQNYTNEFLFSSEKQNLQFFLDLANKKHSATLTKNFVLIVQNSFKIALYPYYFARKLNIDAATSIYVRAKALKLNKLIITCKTVDQEVLNFTKQLSALKIIVLDEKQTYFKLLKKYEHYPLVTNKLIMENKITLSQMLYVMFNKRKTKGYLFSGTILLLGSFIIRYNLYYIIFSSLLYFMALFSYFNTPFNKRITENLLEEEVKP
jgi:hypothetical protein